MHSEAERLAVSIGPRISNVNGRSEAAYFLTKDELRKLFSMNGFNTNGVPWLKMIITFKEVWEEVAPSPTRILDKDDNGWRMYFVHINPSDLLTLKMFGEDNRVPVLAVEA